MANEWHIDGTNCLFVFLFVGYLRLILIRHELILAIICHHSWLVVLAIYAVAAPVFRMSELQCARGPGSPHAEVEAFKDAEAQFS